MVEVHKLSIHAYITSPLDVLEINLSHKAHACLLIYYEHGPLYSHRNFTILFKIAFALLVVPMHTAVSRR